MILFNLSSNIHLRLTITITYRYTHTHTIRPALARNEMIVIKIIPQNANKATTTPPNTQEPSTDSDSIRCNPNPIGIPPVQTGDAGTCLRDVMQLRTMNLVDLGCKGKKCIVEHTRAVALYCVYLICIPAGSGYLVGASHHNTREKK